MNTQYKPKQQPGGASGYTSTKCWLWYPLGHDHHDVIKKTSRFFPHCQGMQYHVIHVCVNIVPHVYISAFNINQQCVIKDPWCHPAGLLRHTEEETLYSSLTT